MSSEDDEDISSGSFISSIDGSINDSSNVISSRDGNMRGVNAHSDDAKRNDDSNDLKIFTRISNVLNSLGHSCVCLTSSDVLQFQNYR